MTPTTPTDDDVYTGYAPPDAAALAREGDAVARDLGARYELRGFVARGGFATVWSAADRTSGQELAVKRLNPHLGRHRDFYRELRAMFVVEHPNVVRIVNVMEAGGTRYLMLELCKGGSLRAALSKARRQRQGTDPRAARQIVGQIARGLAAVHARGFTHRDLKPENVLFTDRVPDPLGTGGAVKLADFGLTDLLAAEGGALRGLTGSPAYMAPEQFIGAPEPASDVYALGVVALELLTGDVPFAGTAEELATHHLRTAPPVPNGLPAVWGELLPAMLSKQPTERPTAAHVADRLGWGEPRPTTKETRAVNPSADDERAGLAREARKATAALSELAAFARRTPSAPYAPQVARPRPGIDTPPAPFDPQVARPRTGIDGGAAFVPEPPPAPADFFDEFESEPAVAPVANDDWFAESPAEPAFADEYAEPETPPEEVVGGDVFAPPGPGPEDTLNFQADGAQHTPAEGYPQPTPDPTGIDDVLDSFQW